MAPTYNIVCGDCLDLLPSIPSGSIDAIIADPPYGTTACKWDTVIPLAPMWEQLKRVIKPKGAIVLFASQPFTSVLVASNLQQFKYCWTWEKNRPNGFVLAKLQPLRNIEDITVFGRGAITYNPQGLTKSETVQKNSKSAGGDIVRGDVLASKGKGKLRTPGATYMQEFTNYPKQTLRFALPSKRFHPTQKPVDLLRYLIRTYTNAGETVLDFTIGSGTTGVAAMLEGRNVIGFDTDPHYCDIARQRISEAAKEAAGSSAKVQAAQPTLQEALPYAD